MKLQLLEILTPNPDCRSPLAELFCTSNELSDTAYICTIVYHMLPSWNMRPRRNIPSPGGRLNKTLRMGAGLETAYIILWSGTDVSSTSLHQHVKIAFIELQLEIGKPIISTEQLGKGHIKVALHTCKQRVCGKLPSTVKALCLTPCHHAGTSCGTLPSHLPALCSNFNHVNTNVYPLDHCPGHRTKPRRSTLPHQ